MLIYFRMSEEQQGTVQSPHQVPGDTAQEMHLRIAFQRARNNEIHAVFPSPKLVPTKVTGLIKWLQGQFVEAWWTRRFAPETPSPASGRV